MHRIALANGRGVAIVDDADADAVSAHAWWILDRGVGCVRHARARINGRDVMLHQFLMRPPRNMQVDHKNGNGLDCRRKNMRIATRSQNAMNRGVRSDNVAGLKGVSYRPKSRRTKKYIASGMVNGKFHYIGSFTTGQAAHRAYRAWARKAHGAFFRAS